MAYHLHTSEGIVFSWHPRGEADASFRIYTKDYGLVKLFAKAVRLEKSKLRGMLDRFATVYIGFVTGKELFRLIHADIIHSGHRTQKEYDRFKAASLIARFLEEITGEFEVDLQVWSLIQEAFKAIEDENFSRDHIRIFFYTFQIKMLFLAGYLPSRHPQVVETLLTREDLLVRERFSLSECAVISDFLRDIHVYATISPESSRIFLL